MLQQCVLQSEIISDIFGQRFCSPKVSGITSWLQTFGEAVHGLWDPECLDLQSQKLQENL